MGSAVEKVRIYVFDSSVFITLNRINENVLTLPQGVWDKLDEMMDEGKIISQRYVYEEVVTNSNHPDRVSAWLAPKKEYFLRETPQQVTYMIEVVQRFPKLIDPENEKEQADPWLVALARDRNSTETDKSFILVTQESQSKTTNLPAACSIYGVESISLKTFFTEVGINFGI
jgi:hypothetical protein